MAGLTTDEAVKNLREIQGPLPDAAARERRLRQAGEILLDRIDSSQVREAYRDALRDR